MWIYPTFLLAKFIISIWLVVIFSENRTIILMIVHVWIMCCDSSAHILLKTMHLPLYHTVTRPLLNLSNTGLTHLNWFSTHWLPSSITDHTMNRRKTLNARFER